jgi:hypothetical protein
VADAVRLALSGGTIHLGRLLASAGVRYVVMIEGLAPSTVGTVAHSVSAPPPVGLEQDLLAQDDLQVVPGEVGVSVFTNGEYMPVTAGRPTALPATTRWSYPAPEDVTGWQPALSALSRGSAATGTLAAGTLYAGYAPAGSFTLRVAGHSPSRRPAFGWAAQYAVPAGSGTLSFTGLPYVPVAVLLELCAWVALVLLLVGWRRAGRRHEEEAA